MRALLEERGRRMAALGAPPSWRLSFFVRKFGGMVGETHIFIQARMTSRRLPGKALRVLAGRPMLGHVIARARSVDAPLCVLTSTDAADDAIAAYCADFGVNVFRGSQDDVLHRFSAAASKSGARAVVRLTGDNPFVAPEIIARCVSAHGRADLTSTRVLKEGHVVKRSAPLGLSVDILDGEALAAADVRASTTEQREHVIPVFFDDASFQTVLVDLHLDEQVLVQNFSVDTEEDFSRAERLFELIGPDADLATLIEAAAQ